jgi:4-alpha-glucanotransferase
MPNTDAWGIDEGYWDIAGNWYSTSAETHRAIVEAMGSDGSMPVPPPANDVIVLQPGQTRSVGRGRLTLEDGATRTIDDALPSDLPLGYHRFEAEGPSYSAWVIVAPPACPLPPERIWGWSAQLYAARSQESWGIGDLADLRRLARWARSTGAGLVMINPLSAGAPLAPLEPSPYYPSSRRFISPLYIRVEEAPGAAAVADKLAELATAGRELNQRRRIDRDEVLRLKLEALSAIFESAKPAVEFDRFRNEMGKQLRGFAVYCALAVRHGADWRQWPDEYRRPLPAAIDRFAEAHPAEVHFHEWLQWVADGQLAAASQELTIVQDLPIGVDPGGADAWLWQDLLAEGCTIGSPPDAFNTNGQNWALPPFSPHKLRASGYEPLVETLRSMLRRARGLRIDHVMGLFRLFWIPDGFHPVRGTYVRYRADETRAVVALEAHRAGAFIVGEDLGTVEPHVRQQLEQSRMLSFRVMYFEPHPPEQYPAMAMAAVSTHDLPTLAGAWLGPGPAEGDVPAYPGEGNHHSLREHVQRMAEIGGEASVEEAIEAAYRRLGRSPSRVLLATLDDALAVREQPNVPGTVAEWPNWSLALPGGLEALEAADLPRRIAAALSRS